MLTRLAFGVEIVATATAELCSSNSGIVSSISGTCESVCGCVSVKWCGVFWSRGECEKVLEIVCRSVCLFCLLFLSNESESQNGRGGRRRCGRGSRCEREISGWRCERMDDDCDWMVPREGWSIRCNEGLPCCIACIVCVCMFVHVIDVHRVRKVSWKYM